MKFEFRGRSEEGRYTVLSIFPSRPIRERTHYDSAGRSLNYAMAYVRVQQRPRVMRPGSRLSYVIRPYDEKTDELPF